MTDTRELHNDAIVIDGLMFYGDGATDGLIAAGVDAASITVFGFEADFEAACDQVARAVAGPRLYSAAALSIATVLLGSYYKVLPGMRD